MLRCPQCTKPLAELARRCPSCAADLDLLVEYVTHLEDGTRQAERYTRAPCASPRCSAAARPFSR